MTSTIVNGPFLPMRPRLSLKPGAWPAGWLWQMKLDEERGVIADDGRLYNRHLAPIAVHKEALFLPTVSILRILFPGRRLDIGLLGFKDIAATRKLRGCVVVYDVPDEGYSFVGRLKVLHALPVLPDNGEPLGAHTVYRLDNYASPSEAWELAQTTPGVEGIIGRRPGALYQFGDSSDMAKVKK